MYKAFSNSNGVKIDPSVLKPEYDFTTPESTRKKLEQLKMIGERKRKIFEGKLLRPIDIRRDKLNDTWNNPELHSTNHLFSNQQKSELIRMAKILAYKTRQNFPTDENKYEESRSEFLRDYGRQIGSLNLYSKINEIFNLYRDKDYSEPMFDKDYLGQSSSESYINSVNDKLTAELYLKKFGIPLDPLTMRSLKARGKEHDFESLALATKEKRVRDVNKELEAQKKGLMDEIEKLEKEREDYEARKVGDPAMPPPYTMISRLAGLKSQVSVIQAQIAEYKSIIEEDKKRKREEDDAIAKKMSFIEAERDRMKKAWKKIRELNDDIASMNASLSIPFEVPPSTPSKNRDKVRKELEEQRKKEIADLERKQKEADDLQAYMSETLKKAKAMGINPDDINPVKLAGKGGGGVNKYGASSGIVGVVGGAGSGKKKK
jgi:flagellar motility protein MotE (MotC chaperone)